MTCHTDARAESRSTEKASLGPSTRTLNGGSFLTFASLSSPLAPHPSQQIVAFAWVPDSAHAEDILPEHEDIGVGLLILYRLIRARTCP